MSGEVAIDWAERFGLARTPLFEQGEDARPEDHTVLLDGGFGSFALSETEEELWKEPKTASWAWSSNLPHHVTVGKDIVAVKRWDNPQPEKFSRPSVDDQLESFYKYLTKDRVRSTKWVVDHVLQAFKRMRALVFESGYQDERSIEAFLAFLNSRMKQDEDGSGVLDLAVGKELLDALPRPGLDALERDFDQRHSSQTLRLFPSLAVRHAGSAIFQEAHFELTYLPGMDLFGDPGMAQSKPVTRGGVHFTPAPLARIIVENAFAQFDDLQHRQSLVVMDPACGSGVFLQETVRHLRNKHYTGRLRLIGRDISPAAVAMSRFVVGHAITDWSVPSGKVLPDIDRADSLEEQLPEADVVLMNPPFVAWAALDDDQRGQMRAILGQKPGRSDLSMAFVTRALDVLNDNGVLGALLPASLLTLQAAQEWRRDIVERGDVRLLASLGDYGLFAHALIQVAAAVVTKPGRGVGRRDTLRAVVSVDNADATGNAMRMLRKMPDEGEEASPDGTWRIFRMPVKKLVNRPTWRLTPPEMDIKLNSLRDAGMSTVKDLFKVHQGVRTGNKKAFVLKRNQFESLLPRERRFFRRAIMNNSIRDGKIEEAFWVFYPYGDPKLAIENEEALRRALPTYFREHLKPKQFSLSARASLSGRLKWWDLSSSRKSWTLDERPRIVSKFFGRQGGFATDLSAEFIPVQSYAWLPKPAAGIDKQDDVEVLSPADLVCAYSALMNSSLFSKILEIYSTHVAGGQFDLSPKYVKDVFLPDLVELARDERMGNTIGKLIRLGRKPRMNESDWRVTVDHIATELYGGDIFNGV